MPTTLPHRPELTELLDASAPDSAVLRGNLRDIRLINRWLGWSAALVRELAAITRVTSADCFTLLDVATGSADIPLAIAAWARRRQIAATILAGDLSPEILAVARQVTGSEITLLCFDALCLPFPTASIDVVACSLALHHFAPEQATALLRELGRVARKAVIVSDLERSRAGYLGARLLTGLLRNRMTHHDAPVSVLRAYTASELRALADEAGLHGAMIRRRFPFRLVLRWERLAFTAAAP